MFFFLNFFFDEVDKELEWCGYVFVCYVDDSNVYVYLMKVGLCVMDVFWCIYVKLNFCINEDKSVVVLVFICKFFGYLMWVVKGGNVKFCVFVKVMEKFKKWICELIMWICG